MRLALRVRVEGRCEDVVVDVDPGASVGELARTLFPRRASFAPAGLGVVAVAVDGARRVLAPSLRVDESGLRSGTVVGACAGGLPAPNATPCATLHVHAGPDAPASFSLAVGASTIGRSPDADVRLTDPLVSKRHAIVHVGETIVIADESSTNGVLMGGRAMGAATLQSGDRVDLGHSTISVTLAGSGRSTSDPGANRIAFNRSPRLDPCYEGISLVAPEPPSAPGAPRFPLAALIAPLVFAGVVFGVTRNPLSILFVALSPVMMLGTWLETRSANRRHLTAATARFRAALADLSTQLEYGLELERAARRREHPSVVEVVEAIDATSALVWTRRPEHASFGRVRLGLGTLPSRNTVEMPATNATLPELWRELIDTVDRFRTVTGVPVVADLADTGNIGVAGPTDVATPVVRGVIAQLVGLHSPSELRLAAFAREAEWGWLAWMPHTSPELLAGDAAQTLGLLGRLEELIVERRTVDRSGSDGPARRVLPLVVVFVHDDTPGDRSRLVQIAETGPAVGVHVLWYAPTVGRLPAACRTFLEFDASGVRAGFVETGAHVDDVHAEPAGEAAAERLARQLSPLVDAAVPEEEAAGLPAEVALVDLLGHDVAIDRQAVAARWRSTGGEPGRDAGLSAIVGRTADGPLRLDLRSQGPHALVGGTTGSGKSEFLQSWIASLAATYGPARVTFLLVDYKGGAAFADCVELPHCVGLVTDLTPLLVRRALASLDAEVRHREALLQRERAKDLVELERRGDRTCPPSLVIVVDEFAALVADVPEFVDGVVNVAQRGRSLGLHLVLATQRPAGVVTDNLRANTNLRVALRMADASDSLDVIGGDDAARFDIDTPGRAIVAAGPGRVTTFQAAYCGGSRAGRPARSTIAVAPLRFGSEAPCPVGTIGDDAPWGPTDLRRIVRMVGDAAVDHRAPRRPWLPELADRYRLEALPPVDSVEALAFGVADDPDRQAQPVVAFDPDVDGNMAVFGTGGSGKSTFLRTIGVAAGLGAAAGRACQVYGIDFASRGLESIAVFPHVGSIIGPDDDERLQRLLRRLGSTVDERASEFAQARASNLVEYRARSGVDMPRVLLLVDGVGAWRADYEGGRRTVWWDRFCSIAADGRAVGVHVVVSADRPASLSSTLAATIQRRLVLRLASDADHAVADVPADVDRSAMPPGRGYLDGRQVQVAVIGGHADLREQAIGSERHADQMRRSGVADTPEVESLSPRVSLDELGPSPDRRPVIGIADDTLAPIGFVPDGVFLVAGPPRSGRTTTVGTIVRSIDTSFDDVDLVLFGCRQSPLAGIVPWAASAAGVPAVAELAERLAEKLPSAEGRRVVLIVEAIDRLLNTDADAALQHLVRIASDVGAFVVAEGETSGLGGSWPLLQHLKSYRCGIVLQPDQIDGEAVLKMPFPRIGRGEFPPGRGLMVQSGSVRKVQVALSE